MGIPALALDESGMCVLALEEGEERVIVSIGHNAAAGSIDLMACLGNVEPSPARVAEALAANFLSPTASVSLAAEPSTGAFIVQRRYSGPDLGDGGLPAALIGFVDDAAAWAKRLGDVGDDGLDAIETVAPARASPGIRG